MVKFVAKKLQQKYLTHILIIFLFLILSSMISFVVMFYLPTAGWLTYKSNKVPLSFRYPKDWPVSQCSEPIIFPQMKIEEVVAFENECDWRQSLNSIGEITIEKFDEAKDPRKDFNSKPFDKTYNRTLKSVAIGNKMGYLKVITPTPKQKVYFVVTDSLVYTISLTGYNFYKGSEAETTRTFEKMLKTFQF